MQKAGDDNRLRKRWLMGALVFMLGQLAFFKYTNFALGTLASFGLFSPDVKLDLPMLIGISFFTFQSMSYIIDVYRRQMEPTRSITDFAFFVSFFPTLLAGPILRARTFLPQLRKPVVVTHEMMGVGTWFIIMGLFKKCIISDYISTNFVSRIFDNPALYSGLENLLGVYGYALQLYCDFSGYSDMAIGIALWMGFHIPANFRAPYKSDSITDFWRRWHISLSTWLRDYLYISLGGNRCSRWRMYFNQFMTMLLGGLWHGASWNFVIWGSVHGVALCAHKAWQKVLGHDKSYHPTGVLPHFGHCAHVPFGMFQLAVLCRQFVRSLGSHADANIHQLPAPAHHAVRERLSRSHSLDARWFCVALPAIALERTSRETHGTRTFHFDGTDARGHDYLGDTGERFGNSTLHLL